MTGVQTCALPIFIIDDPRQYDEAVASKYSDGTPTYMLWEPLRTQTRVTFDVQPNNVTYTPVLTVLYPAEDYDAATNDIAFPQEALSYLSWSLAKRCASLLGIKWTQEMELNHKESLAMYASLNPENSVLYYQR